MRRVIQVMSARDLKDVLMCVLMDASKLTCGK